jgi:type I restriction enzyme, S subunit
VEISKYSLRRGDLLCTRVNGSRRLTGSFFVFESQEPWAYCDHFIRFRVMSDFVIQKYVVIALSTGAARTHIESGMVTTAGQNTINQTSIARAPIPVPPLAEQRRIVAEVERRLSILEDLDAVVHVNLIRADRLRQSILKRAFEGKLVPQDPNDEPASTLLERIRAERAALTQAAAPSTPARGRLRVGKVEAPATASAQSSQTK